MPVWPFIARLVVGQKANRPQEQNPNGKQPDYGPPVMGMNDAKSSRKPQNPKLPKNRMSRSHASANESAANARLSFRELGACGQE
jgi:hypothetical protein